MSPTSYQTAPPRESILTTSVRTVNVSRLAAPQPEALPEAWWRFDRQAQDAGAARAHRVRGGASSLAPTARARNGYKQCPITDITPVATGHSIGAGRMGQKTGAVWRTRVRELTLFVNPYCSRIFFASLYFHLQRAARDRLRLHPLHISRIDLAASTTQAQGSLNHSHARVA